MQNRNLDYNDNYMGGGLEASLQFGIFKIGGSFKIEQDTNYTVQTKISSVQVQGVPKKYLKRKLKKFYFTKLYRFIQISSLKSSQHHLKMC